MQHFNCLFQSNVSEIFESKVAAASISSPKDHYEKIIHCLYLLDGLGRNRFRPESNGAACRKRKPGAVCDPCCFYWANSERASFK